MDRLREELRLEKEKVIHLLHFLAKICLIVLQLLEQKPWLLFWLFIFCVYSVCHVVTFTGDQHDAVEGSAGWQEQRTPARERKVSGLSHSKMKTIIKCRPCFHRLRLLFYERLETSSPCSRFHKKLVILCFIYISEENDKTYNVLHIFNLCAFLMIKFFASLQLWLCRVRIVCKTKLYLNNHRTWLVKKTACGAVVLTQPRVVNPRCEHMHVSSHLLWTDYTFLSVWYNLSSEEILPKLSARLSKVFPYSCHS